MTLTMKALRNVIMKGCGIVDDAVVQLRQLVDVLRSKPWIEEIVVLGNLLDALQKLSDAANKPKKITTDE